MISRTPALFIFAIDSYKKFRAGKFRFKMYHNSVQFKNFSRSYLFNIIKHKLIFILLKTKIYFGNYIGFDPHMFLASQGS